MLDLFAGTGSIALECVSRGCRRAVAVEEAKTQADFIKKTCNELKINNLTLIKGDVFSFLKTCRERFDLVFADPPYEHEHFAKIPDLVLNASLLTPEGVFVLEHSAHFSFDTHPAFTSHRHYGNVNFSFFKNRFLSSEK